MTNLITNGKSTMRRKMIMFTIIYIMTKIIMNGVSIRHKILKLTIIIIYMKINDLKKQKIMVIILQRHKIKLMILKINGENMNSR